MAPENEVQDPFWGWVDLLLFIGVMVALTVLTLLGVGAASLLHPVFKQDPSPLLLPVQAIFYAMIYLAFFIVFRSRYGNIKIFSVLGWRLTVSPVWLLGFFAGGLLLSPLVSAIATLFHTPEVRMDVLEQLKNSPISLALLGLMAITVAPLFEEMIFRGFLQPLLAKNIGIAAAIFITALLFGMLHAFQYKFVWQYVAAVSVVGAVLGYVSYRTKSIMTSAMVHAGFNSMAVLGMILEKHK